MRLLTARPIACHTETQSPACNLALSQTYNFVQFHVVAPREDADDIIRHARCHGIGAGPVGANKYHVEVIPFDTKLVEGMYKVGGGVW